MRKITAFLLIFVMILTLAACGKKDGKEADGAKIDPAMAEVAGSYEGVRLKMVGDDALIDEEFSVELKADGTGTSTRDGDTYKMTWTLDGEKFTMITEAFEVKADKKIKEVEFMKPSDGKEMTLKEFMKLMGQSDDEDDE